jgi:hypothetical protein
MPFPSGPALAAFFFVRNTPGGGVEKILKAFPAFPTPVWRKITAEWIFFGGGQTKQGLNESNGNNRSSQALS